MLFIFGYCEEHQVNLSYSLIILQITPLDDSFTPVKDPRQVQKFRLAVMNYVAAGETHPVPHELPLALPRSLQG